MSQGHYVVSIIGSVRNCIQLDDGTLLVPEGPPGSPYSQQSLPEGSWVAGDEIHTWQWMPLEASSTNYLQRDTRAEQIAAARSRLNSKFESKDICCEPCESLRTVCRPSQNPNEQYIVVPSNDPSVPGSVRYDVCYSCYKRCTPGAGMYTGQDPIICHDRETQTRRIQASNDRANSKRNEKMAARRARQEATFGSGSNSAM